MAKSKELPIQTVQDQGAQKLPRTKTMHFDKGERNILQRSEFTRYIQYNAKRLKASFKSYKKREAILEHPFGTMKRQSVYDYIMTKKGIAVASSYFGLIALAFNLKRMINLKIGKQLTETILSARIRLFHAVLLTVERRIEDFRDEFTRNSIFGRFSCSKLKLII